MANESELLIRIDATTAQLRRELNVGERKLNQFRKNGEKELTRFEKKTASSFNKASAAIKGFHKAAGVAVVIATLTKTFNVLLGSVKELDELAKTAQFAGVTVESLQEIRFAADLAGVGFEQTDKALIKFTKTVGELRAGTGSLFTLLNKSNKSLLETLSASKDSGEAFDIMIDALSGTANGLDRAALASAAFGRSGQLLVNVLKDGKAAFNESKQQARDLSLVLGNETAKRAEILTDKMTILTAQVKAFLQEVAVDAGHLIFGADLPDEELEKIKAKIQELKADPANAGKLTLQVNVEDAAKTFGSFVLGAVNYAENAIKLLPDALISAADKQLTPATETQNKALEEAIAHAAKLTAKKKSSLP